MNRYKTEEGRKLIYDSYDQLLSMWGTDYSEIDIDTTFGRTHVITAGKTANPPLLLFHGTADNSAMMWIYNVKDLAEHFYVIAVDAIGGSGKSEPNARYGKHFDQVVWIDELLSKLKLDRVYLCGVSYGAYLASHYTLERPDRVIKSVGLAGSLPSSLMEYSMRMMKAFLPEALIPTERNCRKLLRKLTGPSYANFENNETLMMHWFYLLKYFNNRSMMYHKIVIHKDEKLQGLRDKVLFVVGEVDRLSNYPKAMRRLEVNGLNYKLIKDAGHAINHELPDVVNRELVDFLR